MWFRPLLNWGVIWPWSWIKWDDIKLRNLYSNSENDRNGHELTTKPRFFYIFVYSSLGRMIQKWFIQKSKIWIPTKDFHKLLEYLETKMPRVCSRRRQKRQLGQPNREIRCVFDIWKQWSKRTKHGQSLASCKTLNSRYF